MTFTRHTFDRPESAAAHGGIRDDIVFVPEPMSPRRSTLAPSATGLTWHPPELHMLQETLVFPPGSLYNADCRMQLQLALGERVWPSEWAST